MPEQFPIHQTALGPDFGKPVVIQDYKGKGEKHFMTHNPIPENTQFETQYKDYVVRFCVDMNFYTDKNFSVVEVIKVTKRSDVPCRPTLTKQEN